MQACCAAGSSGRHGGLRLRLRLPRVLGTRRGGGGGGAALEGGQRARPPEGTRLILLLQLLDKLGQVPLTHRPLLAAHAQVHRGLLLLALADDHDVVPLRHLGLTDLLLQRAVAQHRVGVESPAVQSVAHVAPVLKCVLRHRHDHALTGREPERPLPTEVLAEDASHALHGAQDGTMQDHGPREAARQVGLRALSLVAEVEAQGQLEVELNGPALVPTAQGVLQLDVDLRAVERPVPLIDAPGLASLVQRLLQLRLSLCPELLASQRLLGARAEGQGELEAEELVDVKDEIQGSADLLSDLVLAAEDVGVILLETAHTGEAGEGAAELVPVEHAKGCQSERQLPVGPGLAIKDHAVPRTVHRLQEPLLALHLKAVHVVAVVLVVARLLEEL
mmetsp:Transcript_36658/g.109471  ORF Transcript_36658/g.109471 Transcript_36658/m.109471 type:complete len:391 (-) Transcript_36658:844-2016(-)